MRRKIIQVEYSSDALWNGSDPLMLGYDPRASQGKFEDALYKAISDEFPGADITISNTIEDFHMVNERTDTTDAGIVSELIKEVWRREDWLVKRDTASER